MARIIAAVLLLSLATLASCTSFNPITLARLAMLDPLEVDPGNIAVSLDLPEGLGVLPGGAALEVGVSNTVSGEAQSSQFTLAQNGTDRGNVFRIAEADLQRMRAFQTRARDWKARYGEDAEGSLSLGLEICRAGAGPARDATLSAQISLDGGGSFLPLMRPTSVETITNQPDSPDVAGLPQCPA